MQKTPLKFLAATLVAVAGMLSLGVQSSPVSAAPPRAQSPIVFYVPHQDDETLSMGAVIREHVLNKREVHVVLVTDGSASGAKAKVEAKLGHTITVEEFVKARNNEFLAALEKLGVQKRRVYFEGLKDGALTYDQAGTVISKYQGLYPTAGHYTISWKDDHNDHAQLGLHLRDKCLAGSIYNNDCQFMQFRRYWDKYPVSPYLTLQPHGDAEKLANREYLVWAPELTRYSVGYFSVPHDLDTHYADPISRQHAHNVQ